MYFLSPQIQLLVLLSSVLQLVQCTSSGNDGFRNGFKRWHKTTDDNVFNFTDYANQLYYGPMYYQGGSIMNYGVRIYTVFYGDFTSTAIAHFGNFIKGVGTSDWWKTTLKYYDSQGNHPSTHVEWAGSLHMKYTSGKTIYNAPALLSMAMQSQGWPTNNTFTDIFALVLSNDVNEIQVGGNGSSICNSYCGYHKSDDGFNYIVVGTGEYGCHIDGWNGCIPGPLRHTADESFSVNGDRLTDALIDSFAHELTETVTNAYGAWYDANGNENGDKCATFYDGCKTLKKDGPPFNVDLGSMGKFLIQSNWDPVAQKCVLTPAPVYDIKWRK